MILTSQRVPPVTPGLICEEAMDELLDTDEPAVGQLDEFSGDVAPYAEYRRLAAEHAAVRRVGTLVARGAEPGEVFDAVTREMCRCVPAEAAGLWRYETGDEITMVAAAYHPATEPVMWPVGARTPTAGNTLAATVLRSGGPARMDSYKNVAGSLATQVRAVGIRAAVGVSVIVDGRVWGLAAVGSARPGPMPADTEARISRFAELVASVVVAGYRDEQKRQLLGGASQRPLLVDSLLEGRVLDRWSLCEVARCLRLPVNGPFVVIAAEVTAVGSEALPAVESKLRSREVYSAWRLHPDLQVGIVHVNSERRLDEILGLVSRLATDRVGVSSCFDDLRDTPQALRFAKVMLRGRPHHASPVAVFDGSILATAAVAAPEVMVKSIANALTGFEALPDDERETLCETFRVWQDNDASVRRAAEVLFCHQNTVRHRLRRIEKLTGRSLTRPRDVAELCLASEVRRRLM
jgi:PucR C-terminal helix-turn-helix domain/GGDEF-like domain/GAF domain